MQTYLEGYFRGLAETLASSLVTDAQGRNLALAEGVAAAARLVQERGTAGRKLLFIGNGGSAAIASHMAVDFWKTLGIRALAFNDGSLLTCIGNDCGYAQVFAEPLRMFADPGDVLFAISSSGRSTNILNAARAAAERGCATVTFSGFKPDNPLRALGELNVYVPSEAYGPVESLHHAICHSVLDAIREARRF